MQLFYKIECRIIAFIRLSDVKTQNYVHLSINSGDITFYEQLYYIKSSFHKQDIYLCQVGQINQYLCDILKTKPLLITDYQKTTVDKYQHVTAFKYSVPGTTIKFATHLQQICNLSLQCTSQEDFLYKLIFSSQESEMVSSKCTVIVVKTRHSDLKRQLE